MKRSLLLIALVASSLALNAQNKVAVISAFGTYMDADDDLGHDKVEKFINDEKIAIDAIRPRLDDIWAELGKVFDLMALDYLNTPEYKNMLDGYEYGPADAKFSMIGFDIETGDDLKQDYRIGPDQAILMEGYLALSVNKPFNNKPAILSFLENIPDAKGVILVDFSPTVNFAGSPYGVGSMTPKVSMTVRVFDRELKNLFGRNATGTGEKLDVGMDDFDKEAISASFDKAVDDMIKNIVDRYTKKASKIKW